MVKGAFTDNFVRIDTDIVIIKRHDEEMIDFTVDEKALNVKTKEEAREIIRLLQEGMKFLK